MTDTQDSAKAAKKVAKAEAKRAKKEAKARAAASAPMSAPGPSSPAGLTPAERSAAAAERQVRLQRWRVVFALLMFLIATATFLATARPWEQWGEQEAPTGGQPAEPETG